MREAGVPEPELESLGSSAKMGPLCTELSLPEDLPEYWPSVTISRTPLHCSTFAAQCNAPVSIGPGDIPHAQHTTAALSLP